MLSVPENRQLLSFHRRSLSSNLEDHDLSHRVYRSLLSLFSDNLNSLEKQSFNCITDLQDLPKIRVTPQELKYLQSGLRDICRKHLNRMTRDCLSRNSTIKKAYDDYIREYQPIRAELQNEEKKREGFFSLKTVNKDRTNSGLFSFKSESNNPRYPVKIRKNSFNNENPFRVTPHKIRNGSNNTNNFICNVSQFKAFDSQQVLISSVTSIDRVKTTNDRVNSTYDRQTLASRVRKGSCHVSTTQEREKQVPPIITGEQRTIKEANDNEEEEWQIQNRGFNEKPMKTFYTPRVFAFRNRMQNPETSLPKVDLLRKTKNHWISAVQPQGYKPRSKELTKVLTVK